MRESIEAVEPGERTSEPEQCQESERRRALHQSSVQKPGYRGGMATAIALAGGGVFLRARDGRKLFMPDHYCNRGGGRMRLYEDSRHGILMDTFVVRPLLVPTIAMLLGRWHLVYPHSRLSRSTQVEADVLETQSESKC
jgi:hypothetical protein